MSSTWSLYNRYGAGVGSSFAANFNGKNQTDVNDPMNGNINNLQKYPDTWRLAPPNIRRAWGTLFRAMVGEFVGVFILTFGAHGSKALGLPDETVAAVRGLLTFALTFAFFNWGKLHTNIGVSLGYWMAGLINFWWFLGIIFATGLGSVVGSLTSWGIFGNGGFFASFANLAEYGNFWAIEILVAFAIVFVYTFILVQDRLYREGIVIFSGKWDNGTFFKSHRGDVEDNKNDISSSFVEQPPLPAQGKMIGAKVFDLNHPKSKNEQLWIISEYLPADYNVYSPHSITLGYCVSVAAITYAFALIPTSGAVYNFWLFLPIIFFGGSADIGRHFALYFFSPLIGAVGAGLLVWIYIYLTRNQTFGKYKDVGKKETHSIAFWTPLY